MAGGSWGGLERRLPTDVRGAAGGAGSAAESTDGARRLSTEGE